MVRTVLAGLAATILTGALYAVLYGVPYVTERNDLFLVHKVPSPRDAYHGEYVISFTGVTFYAASLLVFAGSIGLVAIGILRTSRRALLPAAVATFVFSSIYVAIADPRFLLTVLPPSFVDRYSDAFSGIPAVADIHFGWAFLRYLPVIVLVHSVLVYGLMICLKNRYFKVALVAE